MKHSIQTLPNGVKIVAIPADSAKSVTVAVAVKAGSRHEDDEYFGAAHFLEHMCFRGTKLRPNMRDVYLGLDSLGAVSNANTDFDVTYYYITTLPACLRPAAELLFDMTSNSLLTQADLDMERGVIIEEIGGALDDPANLVDEALTNMMFVGNGLGHDILGSKESVNRINSAYLQKFRDRLYCGANTFVFVVGAYDQEDISGLANVFAEMPSGQPSRIEPFEFGAVNKPVVLAKESDINQLQLALAYPMTHNPQSEDLVILDLVLLLMGISWNSLLFCALREKLGLAYALRTDVRAHEDCGYFYISTSVDPAKGLPAIEVILKTLHDLVLDPSIAALDFHKQVNCRQLVLTNESAQNILGDSIDCLLRERQLLSLEQKIALVQNLSEADFTSLIGSLFDPSRLQMVMLGPGADKQAGLNLIEKFIN